MKKIHKGLRIGIQSLPEHVRIKKETEQRMKKNMFSKKDNGVGIQIRYISRKVNNLQTRLTMLIINRQIILLLHLNFPTEEGYGQYEQRGPQERGAEDVNGLCKIGCE